MNFFEIAIIEQYRRLESSVGEDLIEMYLARGIHQVCGGYDRSVAGQQSVSLYHPRTEQKGICLH